MRYKCILFIVTCVFISVSAKIFETRCKLVRELNKVGIPNDIFLGAWVCLIEKVSKRNTKAFTEKTNGRKYYGLYQIPSKWCKVGKPGGDCNVACESLLDDDIRDDTVCAMRIFNSEGFKYWSVWNTRCKMPEINQITTDIYKCPEFIGFRMSPERNEEMNDTFFNLAVKRRLA